jgi:hypothetical protein
METNVHKQDNSNYLNDNMLQQVGCVWQHDPRRGKEYDVLLLEPLALLDQTRGESKYNSLASSPGVSSS